MYQYNLIHIWKLDINISQLWFLGYPICVMKIASDAPLFTQMEDSDTPNKTRLSRNNVFIQIEDNHHNNMCAKKKYFSIHFLQLIHKPFQILAAFTNHCHSVYLHCLWSVHIHRWCHHLPHTYLSLEVTNHQVLIRSQQN